MWGLICRITGPNVEFAVNGFLTTATSTHAGVRFISSVAKELARAPDNYGFNPDNAYTLVFQTWDRAFLNMPSVAYGRNVVGHEAVGLIPDFYYITERGYAHLRHDALSAPAWSQREPKIVWRGSVTGSGSYNAPEDIPRIKLALACRSVPQVDAGLFRLHDHCGGVSSERINKTIDQNGLEGERWPMYFFGRYKYTFDIDGFANAWGLLEKLILGCCVLKVDTPHEQWFYNRLHRWVHYVPVQADLSDLHEKIEFCLANDYLCQWIAHNGQLLANSLALEMELPRSCATIMSVMDVEPSQNMGAHAEPVLAAET